MDLDLPDPSTFEAAIFDCDGTLVDSMPLHYQAWLHALAVCGFPHAFTHERHQANAGMPIPATVAQLNETFGTSLDAARVESARSSYVHARHHLVEPVPEVAGFAKTLYGEKPMAVASGSDAGIVGATLEATGLAHLFDPVITPADVPPGRGKPAPDMFLLAAEKMGVPPERCIVFEDGQLGIAAATAAGMASVFVPSL